MNTERYQLIAYMGTLAALVAVFISALVAAGNHVTITEAFGIGTITGGLIGVLRMPTKNGASDATVTAALGKVPDAPPPPPTATAKLQPGEQAVIEAAELPQPPTDNS